MYLLAWIMLCLIWARGVSGARPCSAGCSAIMHEGFSKIEKLITQLQEKMESVGKDNQSTISEEKTYPKDCYDVKLGGDVIDGVYTVRPSGETIPFEVFCELSVEQSGWLVFQRRIDGSTDFFRTWPDYQHGFGSLTHEFWLGNEQLHALTSRRRYELKVDLEDFEGHQSHAIYRSFSIGQADDYYRLHISGYHGTAGDSLGRHDGMAFSARDLDVDVTPDSCALTYSAAWWFKDCFESNLNGLYQKGRQPTFATGINWKTWKGYMYSLRATQMKIRPMQDNMTQ